MAGGLSYESWTDAPIGMQAARADKIIERFRNASSQVGTMMKETPQTQPVAARTISNADRIRAMSDEELCNFIMDAPAIPCDMKITEMMKANGCRECEKCIMDWLQQPAMEVAK